MCWNENYGKMYATDSRINRKPYFWWNVFLIFSWFLSIALIFVENLYLSILVVFYLIASIYFSYMLTAKRLHDIGFSAWWLLGIASLSILSCVENASPTSVFTLTNAIAGIASLLSLAVGLTLLFKKGTKGGNKYGADLLAPLKVKKEVKTKVERPVKKETRTRKK